MRNSTKSTLRVTIGFVLGAISMLAAQFFCSRFGCPICGMKDTQSSDLAPSHAFTTGTPIPGTLHLFQNQVLFVANDKGVAAIRFSTFGDQNDDAKYEWRFLPRDGSAESNGFGAVFEKYERNETDPNHVTLKDIGSKLDVIAGPIKVHWSYNQIGAGWIICNPKLFASEITSDQTLEDVDLKGKLSSLSPPVK